jgi:uncharacterized membrane protein YeaQ/YmgE (transglycosylase-associated protein family)
MIGNFIAWVVVGGVAGWLASMVMGSNREQGWIQNVIVGVAGAIIGGWVVSIFGVSVVDIISWQSLVTAIIGSPRHRKRTCTARPDARVGEAGSCLPDRRSPR